MDSTSHLQHAILQMICALASIFKIHINTQHAYSTHYTSSTYYTLSSYFFISFWCQRGCSPMVFHLIMLHIISLNFTCSSFTFISLCQRGRNPVVFLFMVPKETQPNGLSLLNGAKGDTAQ
jgi:hypothetical protein